ADPAVRSIATLALAQVKPVPPGTARELAARVREASAAPISLAPSPADPRRMELASNLGATLAAMRDLDQDSEATSAATEILALDGPEMSSGGGGDKRSTGRRKRSAARRHPDIEIARLLVKRGFVPKEVALAALKEQRARAQGKEPRLPFLQLLVKKRMLPAD